MSSLVSLLQVHLLVVFSPLLQLATAYLAVWLRVGLGEVGFLRGRA